MNPNRPIEILMAGDSLADQVMTREAIQHAKLANTKPTDLDRFAGVLRSLENFRFSIATRPPKNS